MSTLRFKKLEIRRSPGFPGGMPELAFASPDVTIVYGPNASGKTTTARVLQALLWPGAHQNGQYSLRGEFDYNGGAWIVDLDAGMILVQQDGRETDHPVFAPFDSSDRYFLGLYELASTDGRKFAEAVHRESAGGYDLAAAAESLGFADRTPRKSAENDAIERARVLVQQAVERQEDLESGETRLIELEEKQRQAREAHRRVDEIKRALALIEAGERRRRAEAALRGFPENLALTSGDESDRLGEIKHKIDLETANRDKTQKALRKAEANLDRIGLPEEGVDGGFIQSLVRLAEELDRKAGEASGLKQELRRAEAKEAEEKNRLGKKLADEGLAKLDLAGLGNLAEFAHQAEILRGQKTAYDAIYDWIGKTEIPRNLDLLREGLGLLNRWISDSGDSVSLSGNRRTALVLAGAALATGGFLGYLRQWEFYGIAVIGLMLIVWAWSTAGHSLGRRQREADFMKLGLTPPVAWNLESVEERAVELHKKLDAGLLELERNQRWANLAENRREIEDRTARLNLRKDELVKEFGLAPDTDEANLFWIAETLRRWQDARTERLGAASAFLESVTVGREMLESLRQSLAAYGYEEIQDRLEAREAIEDLRRRANDWRQTKTEMDNARARLEEAESRLAGLARERAEFYARRGLDDGDERGLADLLQSRPVYLEARDELARAAVQLKIAEEAAGGLEELTGRTFTDLTVDLEESRNLAEELSEISQTLGRIKNAVEEARKSHDLEEALARREDALNRLREARERDARLTAGWMLARYLERENRHRNLPAVFQRARGLYSRITRGRYDLDFDPAERGFRARDTSTGLSLDLNQLSSATRLQLLLAVRMAFVEEQEQGPRLPLLLDETLANSDEERTVAIIQAAIEFCRQGRQVFYFTARFAEVAKWESMLNEAPDVRYTRLDLAEIRRFAEVERWPLIETPEAPRTEVPRPAGRGHGEYGKLLDAPGFDPTREEIGGAHLWHLIDEPEFLYRLLSQGINRWGQFESLIRHGGHTLLDEEKPAVERAGAAARVLKSLAASWRIGRGRKVDRQALVEGGVSKRFIEEVAATAEAEDWNARRIMVALEAGAVKGFRAVSLHKLKAYLEEYQYLDDRQSLTREELRLHALAAASSDIKAGRITAERVENLLARAIAEEK